MGTGQHLVQNDAQGEEIHAMVDTIPLGAHQLGGDVTRRADDPRDVGAGRGRLRLPSRESGLLAEPREAPVRQIDLSEGSDEDVRWFHIAMDDAACVRVGKRACDLHETETSRFVLKLARSSTSSRTSRSERRPTMRIV